MNPVLIIQNCEAESAGSIPEYLHQRGIPSTLLHSYRRPPLPDPTDFSAVINLGCPLSAISYQDHPFLKDLYAFTAEVVRAQVPYLGICFGAQLLARVLGAKVERNPVREIGVYDLRLTDAGRTDPLFEGFATPFKAIHWHGDTFRIPFGAELLVEGDDCRNQAFRSGRAVGLQFHLEARAADFAGWCDSYPAELEELGKTRDQVIASARAAEDSIRSANVRLLDNFFRMNQS